MRFTAVRCHVLLDLVAEGKLHIVRNGALEASIGAYDRLDSPFSQARLTSAVADLYKEGLIKFPTTAHFGAYTGKAELTSWGDSQLIRARDAQAKHAELNKRHAEQRDALKQQHAEDVAALGATEVAPATGEQVRVRQNEAIQRITAFLGQWSKTANAHPEDIYILQTLDREKDELVSLPLRVSDLTMLVNAVLDAR